MKATVKIQHIEAEGDAETIGALLKLVTNALVPPAAPPRRGLSDAPTRKIEGRLTPPARKP